MMIGRRKARQRKADEFNEWILAAESTEFIPLVGRRPTCEMSSEEILNSVLFGRDLLELSDEEEV